MYDITEILRTLLDQHSQVTIVDREFERMLANDEDLKQDYKDWCEENGYELKSGYQEYLDELIESRDSLWEDAINQDL